MPHPAFMAAIDEAEEAVKKLILDSPGVSGTQGTHVAEHDHGITVVLSKIRALRVEVLRK